MTSTRSIPSVSVTYARSGASTTSNELGMRAMQERAYERRGEQYLLIKSPPASDILLAREAHCPANLKAAHDRNDETLERIYIGRRFKNDTERLEKLFEMYTRMTTKVSA